MNHLANMEKQGKELQDILDEDGQVPEWVQEKLALACDGLDTIYDYLSQSPQEKTAMIDRVARRKQALRNQYTP